MSNETPAADETTASAQLAAMEQRLTEVEAQARARVVHAELKAEAIRAGIVDLDGLRLVDTNAFALDQNGNVEGVAAAVSDLRRQKPWLFGGGSSSSAATAPLAQPPRAKLATEMSDAEWRSARADLLRRR